MVLLNIDANEDIQANTEFHYFCRDDNLVDLIQHFPPSQVNTPTYSRGRKRIDYALCSQNLTEFIVSSKIEQEAGVQENADHTAIEVCLDRKKLLRPDKPAHRTAPRKLTQKDPASVRRYQTIVTKMFENHNLLQRIEKWPRCSKKTQIWRWNWKRPC